MTLQPFVPYTVRDKLFNAVNMMTEPSERAIYQVTVKERLRASWSRRFEDLTVTYNANGNTILTGPVEDQASLHGILERIRELNLTLVSIYQIEPKGGCPI
jgi:hypothetical protein